jgi:multimeric flavodoxin WrbA
MPTATLLNCTLKPSPADSSTDALLDLFDDELKAAGYDTQRVRVADHDVKPGVSHDEGDGDQWPSIEEQVMDADLLVFATPIWLGHPASTAQRVLERLDAFISETDDRGQMPPADRIALVGVVGNEDGAHHVGAELYQGLADVGFTIPANGMAYWVGEAMGSTDFKDLGEPPKKVTATVKTAVANGAHLAKALGADPYPSVG